MVAAGPLILLTACHSASLSASPNPFDPTTHGTTSFTRSGCANRGWTITIQDDSGTVVRSFSGNNSQTTQDWDGKGSSGSLVPNGSYLVTLTTECDNGWLGSDSASSSLTLVVGSVVPDLITGLSASNPAFSPNGDGTKDTTTFTARLFSSSPPITWTLEIKNSTGILLRSFSGTRNQPGPISVVWDGTDAGGSLVPEGIYTATLRATAAGATATASTTATADVTLPQVNMTTPAAGAILSGTTTLSAAASDGLSGVTAVDFYYRNLYLDGTQGPWKFLGSDTAAPYQFTGPTVGVADGAIELAVKATDAAGNATALTSLRQVEIRNGDLLGLQPFYSFRAWRAADTLSLAVNRYYGNLVIRVDAGGVKGAGPPEEILLTYDSRSRARGPLGYYGWTLGMMIDRLEPQQDGSVIVAAGSGGRYRFERNAGGTYRRPSGVYLTLVRKQDGTYELVDKAETRWTFNAAGLPQSVKDRDGRTRLYVYDVNGRLMQIVNPLRRTMTLYYDESGRVNGITDSAGRTTSLYSYGANNLQQITYPTGTYASFTYDADHNVTHVSDPRGKSYSIAYVGSGVFDWVTAVTDPAAATTQFQYQALPTDLARIEKDPLAVSWRFDFNQAGAPLSEQNPFGDQTLYERDADQNITKRTDPLGAA